MYSIGEDELLAQANIYFLQRPDLSVKIRIYKVIAGKTTLTKFQAVPTGPSGRAPKEYCGFADDEETALKNCLEKIKDVDNDTIKSWLIKPLFPQKDQTPET